MIPEFQKRRTVELTDGSTIERCEVCGEHLAGEIAEVVMKKDDYDGTEPHLIVHEPCYDRETMEQA